MTWTCEICGDRRPDALISVASASLGLLTRNVRYCADRPACATAARERADADAARWGAGLDASVGSAVVRASAGVGEPDRAVNPVPRAESVRLAPRPFVRVAHYHFPRVWRGRHDERIVTFANGHVYDRAERRRSLRQLVRMMRREKDGT